MNTIVMNTLTGSVTEYDWAFAGLSPSKAGDDSGLYALGGADDNGEAIAASFATGKTLCDTTTKKSCDTAFVAAIGDEGSTGTFTVFGENESWDYPVEVSDRGASRVKPGRGIRETYLGFGYANEDGADFLIDRIEVNVTASSQRRTST